MKVLILGDGLLGTELNNQTGWDVASRKQGNLNIYNPKALSKLIKKYDVVINCIANTNSYSEDQQSHRDINYRFAASVSHICNNESTKLVHISTEFVYANNLKPPTEEDIPFPDGTWYAYTKLLADEYIQLNNFNFLICRGLHKASPFPHKEVWDVKTSGDTVQKIASIIIKLIDKKANGVFNIGTGDKYLEDIAPFSTLVSPPPHVPWDTRMDLTKLNNFLKNE
jgi:nucleoside-diphosphate-sugar epimerase